jgi:hypothetical protein
MPPEILALIDKPELLMAVLAVGAAIGMAVELFLARLRRNAWRSRNRKNRPDDRADEPRPEPRASKALDSADQLRIVMEADFTPQALLNKSEARLFKELDRAVIARNPTWQVMAQVSLGEVLRCQDPQAYSCINSKRVDLLLMDSDCRPRHTIEYQGGGHHQGTAAARDAVKKEALRRAGIGYHEVVAGRMTPTDLKRLVEKLVDKPGQIVP